MGCWLFPFGFRLCSFPPGPMLESVFLWRVSVDRNLIVANLAGLGGPIGRYVFQNHGRSLQNDSQGILRNFVSVCPWAFGSLEGVGFRFLASMFSRSWHQGFPVYRPDVCKALHDLALLSRRKHEALPSMVKLLVDKCRMGLQKARRELSGRRRARECELQDLIPACWPGAGNR